MSQIAKKTGFTHVDDAIGRGEKNLNMFIDEIEVALRNDFFSIDQISRLKKLINSKT